MICDILISLVFFPLSRKLGTPHIEKRAFFAKFDDKFVLLINIESGIWQIGEYLFQC